MGVKPVFKLKTESGKEIRTTGNHPYLVQLTNDKLNARVQLRETGSLEENYGLSQGSLSESYEFSQTRELWTDGSNASSGNLNSSEYSRGERQIWQQGVYPVSLSSQRQSIRDSSLSKVSGRTEIFNSTTGGSSTSTNPRDQQNAFGTDKLSEKEDLSITKKSAEADLVDLTSSSNSWLDNLKRNITKEKSFVKYQNKSGVDPSGVEPDRLGLSSQPSEPAEPTPNLLSQKGLESSTWTKVIYLSPGDLIATVSSPSLCELRSVNCELYVVWDKIQSIEYVGEEQVYDIEVENTHNFIANGILAHNTYMSGNVGIGTTGPDAKLDSSATTEQLRLTYTDGTVYSAHTVDSSGNLTIDNTGTKTIIADDLQITGDDLIMTTNTANDFLMADGTNYNPVTPAAARTGLGLDTGGAGDIWVDEAGDSMVGNLTMSGTSANIILGSNYLSGDGGDEGVFVDSTGNVGIGITAPGTNKLYVNGNDVYLTDDIRAARFFDITGSDAYYLDPANGGSSLIIAGNIVSKSSTPTITGFDGAAYNSLILVGSNTSGGTSVCVSYNSEGASCSGKIDAGTVDPPYTINGKNYATFLPAMTGVKEETTGIITLNKKNPSTNVYESIIDFASQPEASDLWLFAKVTDLKKQIDQMTVLLTPSENTRSWYKIDKENLRLYVYSSRPTNISYRLTAPRFDSEQWSNRRADDAHVGFIINDQGDVTGPPSSVSYNKPEISPQNFVYDGNTENFKQSNSLFTLTGDFVDEFTSVTEALIARLKVGFIETENIVVNNYLIAKEIVVNKINVSEKISSPIVETNKVVTNEIKPANKDLVIDLNPTNTTNTTNPTNDPNAGKLAKLIIKGLAGKTAVVIDAGGNASFSGQIIADSLTVNNDATVAGTLSSNNASISGTLIAKEISSDTIDRLSSNLNDQSSTVNNLSSNINDIQSLLADIKNQPVPDANYYQNIDPNVQTQNFASLQAESLTVTGNSNLYNVSVSGSLLVGTTLIDQNSIISLASELRLSALSTINLFDGAVIIAKDGKITTRGEIIAEGGIRTNEIKPLTDDGRVSINNLAINNLAINNISTNSAIIAAPDFAQNGIFAPAIETATASAGIGILPEGSQEVIIYNDRVKKDSLIYLTPTSSVVSNQLSVFSKETCQTDLTDSTNSNRFNCRPYFKVVTNTPLTLPTKFNWLIIN